MAQKNYTWHFFLKGHGIKCGIMLGGLDKLRGDCISYISL